ncbi:MAG TPA: ABC transporter permease [Streptosporangiaceae bacterium]|nr:ABC transporter permease [Streptosporangiaceae bacterium]
MTDDAGVTGAGPVRGRAARAAVRAGLNAGWIELSHCFTMIADAFEILPIPLMSVVILLAVDVKHVHVPGTHFLIGSTLLAGMLILNVSVNGMAGMAMYVTLAREDGTLLRAKATPNGMLGLLTGKIVVVSGTILLTVVCLLIVGLAPFSGLALGSAGTWLTLAWVLALGLLAMLSVGAALGSLFPSARSGNVMMIGIFGADRHLGDLHPDHPTAGVAAVDRAGISAVLDRARRSFGGAAGQPGSGGNRAFVAASCHGRRAGGLGDRRAGPCPGPAAPRGPPRDRIERGRPAGAGHGPGHMTAWDQMAECGRMPAGDEIPVRDAMTGQSAAWAGRGRARGKA